ncbi:hypothetical protein L873DRAFT_1350886 [Choiromyces venosus 120613-1]|uniref:Secreted protein n=1 Tax=Choiromyces venosus 120613-1 TaxID=1336337 RepID=A0A3N4K7I1_9PEZI|nr:hypothetical protein L873DRAFT_1350886 [Choiromyces venosus 120613-1]
MEFCGFRSLTVFLTFPGVIEAEPYYCFTSGECCGVLYLSYGIFPLPHFVQVGTGAVRVTSRYGPFTSYNTVLGCLLNL